MKRRLIVLCVVLLFSLLSGCGWLYQIGGSSPSSEFDMSKAGLKVPTFEFTNQEGEPFGTKQLEGKYWLADMIFTNCPTVCPTMTPNMQRLQEKLNEEGVDVTFISFTVDPVTDTPEQLKAYAEYYGADLATWHFLTGYSFDEIVEFAEEGFGALVQDLEDSDDIMHSTRFFLVDGEGNVIRRYDGLKADQTEIVEDLLKTVKQ